jgi:putative CocE/NonD family hydrolase
MTMSFARIALALLCAAPVAALPAQTGESTFGRYRTQPQFSEMSTSNFYLAMRDGVKIAVQVNRPARNGVPVEGKFPVIWEAGIGLPGPRGESAQSPAFPNWNALVNQGYVIVTAVRRGNGPSFGIRRGYHDREEAYDAYEITDWLAKQPWSTGQIGMHGCSNTGEAVLHAVSVAPPALRAAWAGCFTWTKYDHFLRGGGIVANWGSGPQRTLEEDLTSQPVDADQDKVLLRQAATEHLQNVNLGDLLRSLPFRDSYSPLTRSRFAVEGSNATYQQQIRRSGTALYIQAGWQDDGRRDAFVALANLPNARLIIGPWKHCRSDDFDSIAEAQRFFDFYLKGIDTGIAKDDPIHYFSVDTTHGNANQGDAEGGEWRTAKAWPLAEVAAVNLSLDARGKRFALRDKAASRAASTTFAIDYQTSCPNPDKLDPTRVQPCHPDKGSASFTGAPLKADTELSGHPQIHLWFSADAPDVNLFVYLEDVAADGKVTTLTEGRIKASLRKANEDAPWKMIGLPYHRAYREDAQPLEPGKAVEAQIDLLPLSYRFAKGHRIQVAVSGADYRERDRKESNPVPQITLYSGGEHASSLQLPVRQAR